MSGPTVQQRERYELAYRNSLQEIGLPSEKKKLKELHLSKDDLSLRRGVLIALEQMAKLEGYELCELVTTG
jgi:hypothetical protein